MEHRDETTSLISIGKVRDTDVYDTDGNHLGRIEDILIEKTSGAVACAVVTFGGLLGIGGTFHQVPWHGLTYDTRQGGYVLGIPLSQADDAPAFTSAVAVV